jgi:hypothetical protein
MLGTMGITTGCSGTTLRADAETERWTDLERQ